MHRCIPYRLALLLLFLAGCTTQPVNPFPQPACQETLQSTMKVHRGTGVRVPSRTALRALQGLQTPSQWTRPPWISNAGYFVPVSDQGQTSECCAFAIEYLIKAQAWRVHGVWPPYDLHTPIYRGAKLLDGDLGDGTTLEHVIEAATNQPLPIAFSLTAVPVTGGDDVPYAVHQYGAVLSALKITDLWETYRGNGVIGISQNIIGSHAQVILGYSDQNGTVYGVTSWGVMWGRCGFWEMSMMEFRLEYVYGYALKVTVQ